MLKLPMVCVLGILIFHINPFNEHLPRFTHIFYVFPSKPDALAVLEVILIVEVFEIFCTTTWL
jgi:hypothetical protein